MTFEDYQFQKGREKTGGRRQGVRNKISEAFLKDLAAEWEKSGPETLKILAKENPEALAKLTAGLLPEQFDDEMPAIIRIVTGVPRGDEVPPLITVPQIPLATPKELAGVPRKDD